MNKEMQAIINSQCVKHYEQALQEYNLECFGNSSNRLRYCSAFVYETTHYYILQSYKTIVAVIEKKSGRCYDVLRYVYGYAATSAQHIAKFDNDYGGFNMARFTYR